jgi:hypothetical protein
MTVDLTGLEIEPVGEKFQLEAFESPMKGAEIERIGEPEGEQEPSEWDYPLRDWEKAWAEKSDTIYPLARTISDIVPYARYIFPSARDSYERKSTGGQTLELGLEALGLLPAAVIGKGLKAGAQGARLTGGFLAKPITKMLPRFIKGLPDPQVMANPFADELMSDVVKYTHQNVRERLAAKYALEGDEIAALAKGQQSVWRAVGGPSGGFMQEKTEALGKLFTKEGTVNKEVLNDVKSWTRPVWEQELGHYVNQANRIFYKIAGTEYKPLDIFKVAASRVYGEAGKALRMDNISIPELGNLMKDVLEHGQTYRKALDITGWAQIKPTRKVFGMADAVWGTYQQFYKPVKNLLRATNIAEINYVRAWHGILAGRNVEGKPLLKMKTNSLGETVLKENYSAKELSNAGKLATDIDYFQSTGKTAAEVQALMDSAPPKVQALAKSLHEWYDWMYADFARNRIPQLFETAGLTERGKAAVQGIMSRPGGVVEMVNGALRSGNNLPFAEKQLVIDNALKSLKQLVSKENLNWFTDKPLKALQKDELKGLVDRLKELQAQLTFRKGEKTLGFPNYIENYTARLPKESVKPWTPEGGLPAEMHAGFTKPRLLEEPGFELKTDIPSLIGARARMQAKELFLYPSIDQHKDFVSRLPKNLKDYSTHWMNRILGIPSPVDVRAAQWLSRFSTKGWDERRVVDVAQKINDMVYLGGIGFKPFSALRNYIQTPLMVPGDLGGIKDQVWLAAGAKKAFEPSTREFIRSIGAIQEYAPDLAFNLKISKHAEGFVDKARDFGMWMFKASDRHNRYWTGGAAMAKWEHFLSKYGENGIVPSRNLDSFKSKLGTASREAWVRKDLDDLLKLGTPESFLEAKKLFVNDVISDTQYLYGLSESPLIGYKWGAPGRVSLVFQSWWMNYADTLSKWLFRTPEPGGGKLISATNERLLTFMLSSALAYESMEPIWGARTAITSVGTGPLPLSLSVPPTWKPFLDGFKTIADSIMLPISGDLDKVRRDSIQLLKDALIFAPGGIQAYQMIQGARKEGLPGVMKSIIKYQPDKEED